MSNPLSIYQRGVYFDGVSKYIVLTGFNLHHSITIEVWTRIHSNSAIYSISKLIDGNDDHLTLGIVPTDRLNFLYAPASYDLVDTNSSFTRFKWHYIVSSVAWNKDAYTSNVSIEVDTVLEAQGTFDEPVLDESAYPHLLGAEIVYSNSQPEYGEFFTGFIYKICFS